MNDNNTYFKSIQPGLLFLNDYDTYYNKDDKLYDLLKSINYKDI